MPTAGRCDLDKISPSMSKEELDAGAPGNFASGNDADAAGRRSPPIREVSSEETKN